MNNELMDRNGCPAAEPDNDLDELIMEVSNAASSLNEKKQAKEAKIKRAKEKLVCPEGFRGTR